MKIFAVFFGVLLIVPALMLACGCCPPASQNSAPVIKQVPCHGCCPETIDLSCETNAVLKTVSNLPRGFENPVLPGAAEISETLLDSASKYRFTSPSVPLPSGPLALTAVLRV